MPRGNLKTCLTGPREVRKKITVFLTVSNNMKDHNKMLMSMLMLYFKIMIFTSNDGKCFFLQES